MKVAIIGGGISGLSTAYYLKTYALPISEIVIYEASSRLGGWLESKKIDTDNGPVYFDKGPRTFRLATGALKEINSIQMAREIGLDSSIQLVSKKHPASLNRYIYFENEIVSVPTHPFKKCPMINKRPISYMFKELSIPPRDSSVKDESIWSFISRRFDSSVADNLVDPVFKGICGGDIKQLSAHMFLGSIYDFELQGGSIFKGMLAKKNAPIKDATDYSDLLKEKAAYRGASVWRLKNGADELTNRLAEILADQSNVKLYLNEPVERVEIDNNKPRNSVQIKSKTREEHFDIVISSVFSQYNSQFLSEKHAKLSSIFNKIKAVDMVVINLFFKSDILPVEGFGYLCPTNQNSPILGCIFDSVFSKPGPGQSNNTVLTVMMGGHWYEQYIGNKSQNEILQTALDELKRQLNFSIEPDCYEISIMKNAIPQYKVGHRDILDELSSCLKDEQLSDKFYATGYSYEGVGVNDCIFNARNLVQKVLANNPMVLAEIK